MKTIFIVYNQAITEEILEVLEEHAIRGFTKWTDVQGRGSKTGDPHMGTHTWPPMNGAMLSVVPDDKVSGIFESLRKTNAAAKDQGLKAFSWPVEEFLDE